jgi:hypothetical protein
MNRLPHASLFRQDIVLHQVEMMRVKCDEKRFLKLDSTAVLVYLTRLFVCLMGERLVIRRLYSGHISYILLLIIQLRSH